MHYSLIDLLSEILYVFISGKSISWDFPGIYFRFTKILFRLDFVYFELRCASYAPLQNRKERIARVLKL